MEIRLAESDDRADVLALTRAAFPDEDLRPLVTALFGRPETACLMAGPPADAGGYAVLTVCSVAGDAPAPRAPEQSVALLGPVAVRPDLQRRGIGQALIRAGIDRMRADGRAAIFVLGDPAYYGRFGFVPTAVVPPYGLPDAWAEAWRALPLVPQAVEAGTLIVPEPWRHRALWRDD